MALVSQLNRTGYSIPAVLSLLTLLTSVIGLVPSYSTFCEHQNEFTSQDGRTSLPSTTCRFIDDSSDHLNMSTNLICEQEPDKILPCPSYLLSSATILDAIMTDNHTRSVELGSSGLTILGDVLTPHDSHNNLTNNIMPHLKIDLSQIRANFFTIDERWFRLLVKKSCMMMNQRQKRSAHNANSLCNRLKVMR